MARRPPRPARPPIPTPFPEEMLEKLQVEADPALLAAAPTLLGGEDAERLLSDLEDVCSPEEAARRSAYARDQIEEAMRPKCMPLPPGAPPAPTEIPPLEEVVSELTDRFRVAQDCFATINDQRTRMRAGKIVESGQYDIDLLRRQGVVLEPA